MNWIQNNTVNITSAMIQKDSHLPSVQCCFSVKAIIQGKKLQEGTSSDDRPIACFKTVRFQLNRMSLQGPFQHELFYKPMILKWEEAEK